MPLIPRLKLGCIILLCVGENIRHIKADNSNNGLEKLEKLEKRSRNVSVGEEMLIWAVKLKATNDMRDTVKLANKISEDLGLKNVGQIGELEDHYLFMFIPASYYRETRHIRINYALAHMHSIHQKHLTRRDFDSVARETTLRLKVHPAIEWSGQQITKSRQKRSSMQFNDPLYKKQWHLTNLRDKDMDINVTGVWERNITGRGVVVAIVDDGVEWTNPDLRANYSPEGSWDLNGEDPDPMPSGSKIENHHGTRCAGEVAAATNQFCGVGVAYGGKVSGLKVLDGPMTDSLEASAFNKNMQINDIYSCSWGPDDDGQTVDGPHYLAKTAMRYGIDFGRGGYGSIYVVASGNGGQYLDNCNYDGYANSIYTITIGAVDETGQMPYYGEECASMLAVTFSSGSSGHRSIVTTDWRKDGGTGCTLGHSGTSAAAPLAAGMIALMLEVRPCLSWRDIQFLIVITALKVDINIAQWQKNGAGLHHSAQHGFGLMKAWRLVNAAKVWELVPWMTSYTSEQFNPQTTIPNGGYSLTLRYQVTSTMLLGYELSSIEQVQMIVTISHWRRGKLEIRLVCPSGTQSVIGSARPHDNSSEGLTDWIFSTVRCWGEEPIGNWSLIITDNSKRYEPEGVLMKWQLRLHGSSMTAEELQSRRRLVEKAMSGEFLNDSYHLPCPPPSVNPIPEKPILSEKTLKVLLLTSVFFLAMAIYETFEYLLCYNEEKKEEKRLLNLTASARRMACMNNGATYFQVPGDSTDTAIPMDEEYVPMTTLTSLPVVDSEQEEDILYSAVTDARHAGKAFSLNYNLSNSGIPKEILESLSEEELKLNLEYSSDNCSVIKSQKLTKDLQKMSQDEEKTAGTFLSEERPSSNIQDYSLQAEIVKVSHSFEKGVPVSVIAQSPKSLVNSATAYHTEPHTDLLSSASTHNFRSSNGAQCFDSSNKGSHQGDPARLSSLTEDVSESGSDTELLSGCKNTKSSHSYTFR